MSSRTIPRQAGYPLHWVVAPGYLRHGQRLCLFILLLGAVCLGSDSYYAGASFQAYPWLGDVSGLQPGRQPHCSPGMTYPETARMVFQEGDKVWVARLVELGLIFDPRTALWRATSWAAAAIP